MKCYLFEAPTYLFFAPDLPELLYYSHIPATIIALLVGCFVFFYNPKNLLNQLLFLIAVCFSLWTTASLLAWTNVNGDFLAFVWPLFAVMPAFIAIFSIYFIYVFLFKRDVSFNLKLVFLALILPVLLLAHTDANIYGFNIVNCDAFDFEGLYYKIYYTGLGFLAVVWILFLLIREYKVATTEFKKQIILMGLGLEFFLITFIGSTFVVTYLTGLGYFEDSRLEMYGLFGMVVFMVMMGILIVQFKTFKVGIIASNALVIALLVLVGSQITFSSNATSTVLTVITLILTSLVGYVLIHSVKKEISQRQEIESLAKRLKTANNRLKELDKLKSEFVSIASHQLRSPLTSIRGYASMLLEGSYGKLSPKATEAVERISESSRSMATSVEDYLNVSRIESGNMKYELSDFNLRDEVEHIVNDLRPEAIKKGLLLTFKTDLVSKGITNADIGKVRQILHNLINNSLKYTPKGSIEVLIKDNKKKKRLLVHITDTGVGMDEVALDTVFDKFVRAKNANHVNVTGTGLGLYVARKMATEMKGDITASSPGENLGSTFTLELPLHL